MAILQTIQIDGQDVPFKASAALPRLYMAKYGRNLIQDFESLTQAMRPTEGGDGEKHSPIIDVQTLMIFENIAHTMAQYADPAVPDSADEWLEQFNTLSIYMILPQILRIWGLNNRTEAEAKKNLDRVTDH